MTGQTALLFSYQSKQLDLMKRFIERAKYIYTDYIHAQVLLYSAAECGHLETFKCILTKLSKPLSMFHVHTELNHHKDKFTGNTSLHIACSHENLDLVQYLINEIGCNPPMTAINMVRHVFTWLQKLVVFLWYSTLLRKSCVFLSLLIHIQIL